MKKGIFSLSFLLFFAVITFGQKQKFKIFGVKITANEIVGNNSFNDLGLKYHTTVINTFTDDSATYFWRLGSVRVNANQFRNGTFPLFNLSYANNKKGYLLLDSIDFSYYREYGFSILESKDSNLIKDKKYSAFKKYIYSDNYSLLEKRNFLWLDENRDLREKIFKSKYFRNVQKVNLKDSTAKKLKIGLGLKIESDLDNVFQLISLAKKSNDNTLTSLDSLAVKMYLSRLINKVVNLEGEYISIRFREEYINKLEYVIRKINSYDPILAEENEFNENLLSYLNDTTKDCKSYNYSINTSISAFQFRGNLKSTKEIRDSINSDLSIILNLNDKTKSKISTIINASLSKSLDRVFSNEFSKVWIFMFGTDYRIDTLKLKNTIECDCNSLNNYQYSNYSGNHSHE